MCCITRCCAQLGVADADVLNLREAAIYHNIELQATKWPLIDEHRTTGEQVKGIKSKTGHYPTCNAFY